METFASSEPWLLTVIRVQGILFLRPEKSWRPVVSITLRDTAQPPYEVMLGCDGQNPNLRIPFVLNDVDETTRLDITVWHKSHRKSRKKRHMVGSAYVSLGELIKRQEWPYEALSIHLRCPPPQKRSPKLPSSSRQTNMATLTVRIRAPNALLPRSCASSMSATLVASPSPSVHGDDEKGDSEEEGSTLVVDSAYDLPASDTDTLLKTPPDILTDPGARGLRRRKTIKPYCLNTSDEDDGSMSCSSPDGQPNMHFPVAGEMEEQYISGRVFPILPQYREYNEEAGTSVELSLIERAVDRFAPYREMNDPGCDFALVQRRLMGEWYVVSGALLAVAGLNAAVFGFSPGTILNIDNVAVGSVLCGSIIASIGLVADIGFLVCYSGADPEKFERVSRDVYGSHFFFCLTCRFPTLCLFLSTCALMFFLLAVAWTAWPTAVLVLCCLAGTLLTLQYLVFGAHRLANFIVWTVQLVWRAAARGIGGGCGRDRSTGGTTPSTEARGHEDERMGDRSRAQAGGDAGAKRPA